MDWIRASRALVGTVAGIALVGMIVAQFVYPRLVVEPSTIGLLLLVIGTTLGLDRLVERELPVKITVGEEKEK